MPSLCTAIVKIFAGYQVYLPKALHSSITAVNAGNLNKIGAEHSGMLLKQICNALCARWRSGPCTSQNSLVNLCM